MSNINAVVLSGGILKADTMQCNIGTFTQTGGSVTGSAIVSAQMATLSNAVINASPVTAVQLTLSGFTSLNGGSLTVTSIGIVSASSQLTLGSGAKFVVSAGAHVSQSTPLQILPSGTTIVPYFQNDGIWTSTSMLTLNTLTQGKGSFSFGSGSSLSATGITFSTGALVLTSATFNVIGSIVTIGSIDGNGGTITSQGQVFTVTGHMNVGTFTHKNGNTNIATGTLGTLDVQTGTFSVTGSGLAVNTITFEGGLITATGSAIMITASTTTISGNMPKTIETVTISSTAINLSCGAQQCELLTLNGALVTPTS